MNKKNYAVGDVINKSGSNVVPNPEVTPDSPKLTSLGINSVNYSVGGSGGGGGLQYVNELPNPTEEEFNKHNLYLLNGSTYYLYRRVKDFKSEKLKKELTIKHQTSKSLIANNKIVMIGGDSTNIVEYDPITDQETEVATGLYNKYPESATEDCKGKIIIQWQKNSGDNAKKIVNVYDPITKEFINYPEGTLSMSFTNNPSKKDPQNNYFVLNSDLQGLGLNSESGSTSFSQITIVNHKQSNLAPYDHIDSSLYFKRLFGISSIVGNKNINILNCLRKISDYSYYVSYIVLDSKTNKYLQAMNPRSFYSDSELTPSDSFLKTLGIDENSNQVYFKYDNVSSNIKAIYTYDIISNEFYKIPNAIEAAMPKMANIFHSSPLGLINDKLYGMYHFYNGDTATHTEYIYEIEPEFEYKYARI